MGKIHESEFREGRSHPSDSFLRPEMFPTVWCPGCGIGTALYGFLEAGRDAEIPVDRLRVVTGIGCTGPIAGSLALKTHGVGGRSPVRFAIDLKARHPELTIGVFLNNADLMLSGAEGLKEAGRRKLPLTVIVVNNFVLSVSRNGAFPMTPYRRRSRDGRFELPFNIPDMACAYGAAYVARWTPLREGWMKESMADSFSVSPGFSLIEVISPCLLYDANGGRILDSIDRMKYYNDHSEIRFGAATANLDLRRRKTIILGVFRDRSRKRGEERP